MIRTTLTRDDDVAAALAARRPGGHDSVRSEQPCELPTFDPGRALITDHRALKELLDEQDIERALRRRE